MIPRSRRALRAGLVLGLLAVQLAGCNLFKPAVPEAGDGGTTLLANYASPESCLYYMRLGIERKDEDGRLAYLGALADLTSDGMAFNAFVDPEVMRLHPDVDSTAAWGLDLERPFVSDFFRLHGDPYQMKWLPDVNHPYDYESPSGDRRVLHRRYEVRALRAKTQDTLLIAVGYADLSFARISASRWALYRWEDRLDLTIGAQPRDPENQTFGSRRLNARQGG